MLVSICPLFRLGERYVEIVFLILILRQRRQLKGENTMAIKTHNAPLFQMKPDKYVKSQTKRKY